MSKPRFQILIVERPDRWAPSSWREMPDSADVLRVDQTGLKRRRAVGLAFGFNSAAMANNSPLWAMILPDFGRNIGRIDK